MLLDKIKNNKSEEKPRLTIGFATYDDYDGVYFSIQSIRLHHPEVLDRVNFIIIDNNPDGKHGEGIRKLAEKIPNLRYIRYTDKVSTSIRNKIFEEAETEYVLSLDCHVILGLGSLEKLIDYFDAGLDDGNLIQGPMIHNDMKGVSTHLDSTWAGGMWGKWKTDERGIDPNSDPFEIPSHGLGLFACRKDSWLGFNPNFNGFGGEEGYIHEKYRQHGKKAICLPSLRWLHRFYRPNGPPYKVSSEAKVENYYVGFLELGLDVTPVTEYFSSYIPRALVNNMYIRAKARFDESVRSEASLAGVEPEKKKRFKFRK